MRVLILFATVFIALTNRCLSENITVKNGTLDLRNSPFDETGTVYVSGDWEFYWGKLLSPEEIGQHKRDTFLRIPGYFGDIGYPQVGVATLRLKILLPKRQESLTLYVNDVLCSYKIWANGVLMGEVGKVDLQESKALYYPMVFNLPYDVEECELIMQIANHSHRYGGIYSSIKIGTPREIMIYRFWISSKNLMAFTALMVMAIYNLMMFRLRRQEVSFLYMGIFAFLLGYRSLFSEEKLIIYFYKEMGLEWMYKFDLWGFYLAVPLFLSYFTVMFRQASYVPLVRLIQFFLYGCSLIVLFTPVSFNIYTLDKAHLAIGVAVIYVLIVLTIALIKKMPNSRLFGLAVVVLASTTVNDLLFHQNIIESVELTQLGSVSFIFFQTYELYRRFNQTFKQNEFLRLELENENKRLESRVEKRTIQLRTVNEDLLKNQQELMSLAESLEQASSDINRQKREIEIKNQKLTQSIVYASRIQNSLLPSQQRLKNLFQDDYFVFWRPRDIVGGDFYWGNLVNDSIVIAGGDCTGHGVPGALLSMICIALLNESIRRPDIHNPAQVLEFMRERIKAMLQQNNQERQDGADVVVCEFNLKTNRLIVSCAKLGILIIREQSKAPFRELPNTKLTQINNYQVLKIYGSKQPIGAHPSESPFFNFEIECERGDRIYIFTDGLQDQFGGKLDNKLGLSALTRMLVETQKPKIADQLKDIEILFDTWRGERNQIDDIMLFAIEWKGRPKTKLLV